MECYRVYVSTYVVWVVKGTYFYSSQAVRSTTTATFEQAGASHVCIFAPAKCAMGLPGASLFQERSRPTTHVYHPELRAPQEIQRGSSSLGAPRACRWPIPRSAHIVRLVRRLARPDVSKSKVRQVRDDNTGVEQLHGHSLLKPEHTYSMGKTFWVGEQQRWAKMGRLIIIIKPCCLCFTFFSSASCVQTTQVITEFSTTCALVHNRNGRRIGIIHRRWCYYRTRVKFNGSTAYTYRAAKRQKSHYGFIKSTTQYVH